MIDKPEIFAKADTYGTMTKYEYEWFSESLEEMDLEMLNQLIELVYKEGMKDGISLYKLLET